MKPVRLVSLFSVLLVAGGARSAEPVYAGYYRGSAMSSNVIYSFTSIANPADQAKRVGSAVFQSNWKCLAFDGANYFSFIRTPSRPGAPGLFKYDINSMITLISSNADTRIVYTFLNWHGLGYCRPDFYGLYNGTNMSGPGLYRFTNPADPENSAERLFAPQTFPSNLWSDVEFDGERWLFVRQVSAGSPGIYQYDPQADSFSIISGTEAYTNWDGLSVYVERPSTNVPLLHKKIYVILLGGQSNALGWGYHQYLPDTGNPLAFPQNDAELFTDKGLSSLLGTLVPMQSGAGNGTVQTNVSGTVFYQYPALTNAPVNRFGPELSLGRTVRDRIRIPNAKVVIVKCAYPNTSIYSNWVPDGTANSAADGQMYQNFQTIVWSGSAALQTKYPDYEIEFIGMGWVQGEADAAGTQRTNYQANLTRLIADVRATFGTNMIFAFSKLSTNQSASADYATVRAAQDAVAASVPGAVATETLGPDYLTAKNFTEGSAHYLSPALLQIGQDLGNAIMDNCGLDSDNDGLPDSWENEYAPGLAWLGNSPQADTDGDGVTDIQEFQAGTSPVDPADRLDLSVTPGMHGRWAAKKNIRYQMFSSTNMISWAEFGGPVLVTDSNRSVEVDCSTYISTNKAGFFKIMIH